MKMGGWHIDTQEQIVVHMCGFEGIRRGNYLRGEPVGKAEVEMRVSKLKNEKVARKDEITGEMIKGEGDRVVDWIWRLCYVAFESGIVPEDWKSTVIVPACKGKGERTEYKNYRCISLLSVFGKIYVGISVDRVRRVTVGLTDDEQGNFRAGSGL